MDKARPDDFTNKTEAFQTWLVRNGVEMRPSVRIADLRSRGKGRGLVTTEHIEQDDVIFKINSRSTLIGGAGGVKDAADQKTGSWISLLLELLVEYGKHQRRQSHWNEYLDILPSSAGDFDTLMFWSDAELKELQACAIVDRIGKQSAEDTFRTLLSEIRREPAHYGFADFEKQGSANYDAEFERAFIERAHVLSSLIMAYAFDTEPFLPAQRGVAHAGANDAEADEWEEDDDDDHQDEEDLPKCMVPLADLLNADASRNNARLFYDDDGSLVMRATKPILKESEIYNYYGPLPPAELLRRYGYYADGHEAHTVVDVPLDMWLSGSEAGYDIPTELCDLLDCELHELPDTFDITYEDVEALASSKLEDLTTLGPLLSALAAGRDDDTEAKVAAQVEHVLLLRLAQYATTLEQDEKLMLRFPSHEGAMETDRSRRRLHMALQVRMGEKRLLRDALVAFGRIRSRGIEREGGERQHKRQKR